MRLLFPTFLICLGTVPFAVAVENDGAARPSVEETIEAAKKEIDHLQGPDLSKQGRGSRIGGGLPELDPLIAPSVPMQTSSEKLEKDLRKQQKKKENWLLEGMEKTARTSADGRLIEKDKGRDPHSNTEFASAAEEEALTDGDPFTATEAEIEANRSSERTAGEEKKVEVVNPLDSFMASWISPKDAEILRASGAMKDAGRASSTGSAGHELIASLSLPGGGSSSGGGGLDLSNLNFGGDRFSRTAGGDAVNPFLAGLELPPPGPAASGPSANINAFAPPPPTASSMFESPDSAAPKYEKRDDQRYTPPPRTDKYFPQLNRF